MLNFRIGAQKARETAQADLERIESLKSQFKEQYLRYMDALQQGDIESMETPYRFISSPGVLADIADVNLEAKHSIFMAYGEVISQADNLIQNFSDRNINELSQNEIDHLTQSGRAISGYRLIIYLIERSLSLISKMFDESPEPDSPEKLVLVDSEDFIKLNEMIFVLNSISKKLTSLGLDVVVEFDQSSKEVIEVSQAVESMETVLSEAEMKLTETYEEIEVIDVDLIEARDLLAQSVSLTAADFIRSIYGRHNDFEHTDMAMFYGRMYGSNFTNIDNQNFTYIRNLEDDKLKLTLLGVAIEMASIKLKFAIDLDKDYTHEAFLNKMMEDGLITQTQYRYMLAIIDDYLKSSLSKKVYIQSLRNKVKLDSPEENTEQEKETGSRFEIEGLSIEDAALYDYITIHLYRYTNNNGPKLSLNQYFKEFGEGRFDKNAVNRVMQKYLAIVRKLIEFANSDKNVRIGDVYKAYESRLLTGKTLVGTNNIYEMMYHEFAITSGYKLPLRDFLFYLGNYSDRIIPFLVEDAPAKQDLIDNEQEEPPKNELLGDFEFNNFTKKIDDKYSLLREYLRYYLYIHVNPDAEKIKLSMKSVLGEMLVERGSEESDLDYHQVNIHLSENWAYSITDNCLALLNGILSELAMLCRTNPEITFNEVMELVNQNKIYGLRKSQFRNSWSKVYTLFANEVLKDTKLVDFINLIQEDKPVLSIVVSPVKAEGDLVNQEQHRNIINLEAGRQLYAAMSELSDRISNLFIERFGNDHLIDWLKVYNIDKILNISLENISNPAALIEALSESLTKKLHAYGVAQSRKQYVDESIEEVDRFLRDLKETTDVRVIKTMLDNITSYENYTNSHRLILILRLLELENKVSVLSIISHIELKLKIMRRGMESHHTSRGSITGDRSDAAWDHKGSHERGNFPQQNGDQEL